MRSTVWARGVPCGRGIGLKEDGGARKKSRGLRVEVFDKSDVKRIKDCTCRVIPEAICLRMWSVTDEGARRRALIYFWVMRLD